MKTSACFPATIALSALAFALFSSACERTQAPVNPGIAQAAPVKAYVAAEDRPGSPADYKPQVGQAGKDVVWVPTPQAVVDRMLDMAKLTPQDRLVDLGSGDGITVITAAKRGAQARGIEYNPDMVALAKQRAREAGVTERASFEQADIFKSDFSDATVVTLFLLPELNLRLRPTLLEMKPGTRVVSNSFDMGDWTADQTAEVSEGCTNYCNAMLWIVPAKVEGHWRMADGQTLQLTQRYQTLEGRLGQGNNGAALSDARMDGAQIQFRNGGKQYTGTVEGNRISGTIDGKQPWSATRSGS